MSLGRHLRTRCLLALGGLAVVMMIAGLTFGMTSKAEAHIPHPGLAINLEAVGEEGCDTSGGDTVCFMDPGTTFTLNVVLESLPDDIPSYEGFDIVLAYTGLTSADDGSTEDWPDCGFPAQFYAPGRVAMSCAIGIPPAGPSTYAGVIGKNDFTCDASGTITLEHGVGFTILLETVGIEHTEGANETLDITCGDPPTPTSTPGPATPALPTALPGTGTAGGINQGGTGLATWVAIAVLLAIAAVTTGALGWRFARTARER